MQCAPMKQSISKIKNRTFASNDFGNLTVCEDFDFFFLYFIISNLYIVILKSPKFSYLILKQFLTAIAALPFNRNCHRMVAEKKKKLEERKEKPSIIQRIRRKKEENNSINPKKKGIYKSEK